MKRTQVIELLANIRKTFVSFFSILMFVALGVGIFLGISWSAPALENAADNVAVDGSLHDFQVQYVYGLTDDDVAKIADVEGVTAVEAERQSFQTLQIDGDEKTVKVQSLGQDIDVSVMVEGELPAQAGEIAFGAVAALECGIKVGDTVEFASSADGTAYLGSSSFKVTALVNSAEYLAVSSAGYGYAPTPSGSVDLIAWVLDDEFNPEAFRDGYPLVNVRADGLRGKNMFSQDYRQEANALKERISELAVSLGNARYEALTDSAQASIDDGQKQVDEGKTQIAEGEKQLADGRATLETERANGEAKLSDAHQQLVSGQARYDSGLAAYKQKKAEYDRVVSAAESGKSTVASLRSDLKKLDDDYRTGKISEKDYDKGKAKLASRANDAVKPLRKYGDIPTVTADNLDSALSLASKALSTYRTVPIEIEGKKMTLDEASKQLSKAKKKLDSAREKLQSGWSQYYAGQSELEQKTSEAEQRIDAGEHELEDARQQVADGEVRLESAREQLDQFVQRDASTLTRANNSGIMQVETFADVTSSLSFSMAALFIIVGLLVSYSAVSRIVHEQVTQIGTKKALGLRNGEITASFLWYSGVAVIVGAIVGTIVGVLLVEGIIGHVLGKRFIMGDYPAYFGPGLFAIVSLIEFVLVLGATYLACRSILKEQAVELLRGEKPPEAKTRFYEKWRLWNRLPLFTQTMVNNCVNDKRRVFSTVVGVAGCTALIVTAITLNNDVLASYDRQYAQVYDFNAIAYIDSETEEETGAVAEALANEGVESTKVLRKGFSVSKPDGSDASAVAIVPTDAETFEQLYHIRPVSGVPFDSDLQGAWLTQAYAAHFGLKAGDSVTLRGTDGETHDVPVLGIYEFWLTYHEIVMSGAYYENEFGAKAVPNVILVDTGDRTVDDLAAALAGTPGFYFIGNNKAALHKNFADFATVSSSVVAIYLALAVLMAVVVLLNLNVMFIEEKKRELIVLMINGFSVRDAKRYIYNDTIVLTVLGILVGLVVGCVMGAITVGAVEPSSGMFVKDVDGIAVLAGVVGSALLAFAMTMIALRRVSRFKLTDINKM